MSRLPQPGDAVKATTLLNERLNAAVGVGKDDAIVRTGSVTLDPSGLHGPGVPSLLAIYGDLFDITETLDDAGFAGMLTAHEKDLEAGNDMLDSCLVAIALQSIAFGVLMERNRWERGDPAAGELREALREARPYVYNRACETQDWRSETAQSVLRRVDEALGADR